MTTAFYRNGMVAVTQGSKVVTGTGTNWATGATKPLAGDVFIFKNKIYEVEHVISNTEIRLFRNFEDATATAQTYVIMRNASLNISSRIAAQVAQVVNQKQIMLDEFHEFLTNNTDPTVNLTDTLGNQIPVTPIPMLDASHNQAIKDLNDKADQVISSNILMSESEARAINRINEAKYDASGFVDMGRSLANSAVSIVNEGLQVTGGNDTSISGKVAIGFGDSSRDAGNSKSGIAVTHIAGAITKLFTGNGLDTYGLTHQFPEPEDGARVTDSTGDTRGSGKATLDLKVDVDPKYGNVPTGTDAQILREAVGRASEGLIRNGDFRDGGNYWSTASVVDGVNTINGPQFSGGDVFNIVAGQEYTVKINFKEIIGGLQVRLRGSSVSYQFSTNVSPASSEYFFEYTFTARDSGKFELIVYPTAAGRSASFSNVSVIKATEEVVTHRVDLAAWEYFEEELTGRLEIMECVGSTATTFGTTSVPTVLSERPLSYFQQFDGQFDDPTLQNNRYRCVVWDQLTEPQKREIAAYMKERLFKGMNGFPVNGRLRPRTFRGLGNGDWENTDCNVDNALLRHSYITRVRPQGRRDAAPSMSGSSSHGYAGMNGQYPSVLKAKGVYAPYGNDANSGAAYQGRCFLYVVATIPRTNKGAYVEDVNPWGTRAFVKSGQGWDNHWYETGREWTMAELFILSESADVDSTWRVGSASGSIKSGISGHPDGIFYDGIEAGGLNGVIDWRLPAVANDSPEEAAKVEAKVENKTYRGLEKLVWTVIATYLQTSSSSTNGFVVGDGIGKFSVGDVVSIQRVSTGVMTHTAVKIIELGSNYFRTDVFFERFSEDYNIVHTSKTNLSVSGEFNTKMVVGDPVNLLQINGLKGGWLGTWYPDFAYTNSARELTRRALASPRNQRYTNDLGATWGTATWPYTDSTNSLFFNLSTDRVVIISYKAWAKPTKKSSNKRVYSANAGLMPVTQIQSFQAQYGTFLGESLIGKVMKSSSSGHANRVLGDVWDFYIPASGAIGTYAGNLPTHKALTMPQPNNDSPAVKVLPYQISNNGQGSIGYQANELTWGSPTFLNANSPGKAIVKGEVYFIQAGANSEGLQGHTIRVKADNSGILWANYVVINGVVCSSSTKSPSGVLELWNGSFWGDDDKIKITADGSDTFVDKNGNTNLSVVHELAIPYGWTSNHARAGKQVPGVDL